MLRNIITNDWLTILCVICINCIALAKFYYTLRFNDFAIVLGNSKYLKIYSRDQKFIDAFDAILFVNFAISTSVFVYLLYSIFVEPIAFDLILYLKLLLVLSTFIIIKVLVERLLGSLFEIDALIDSYLFQKTTYKNFIGLLILVFNLLIIYAGWQSQSFIYALLIAMAIIILAGFITSYKNHQKLINLNFFYFLLYLCALEIGPYILIYKIIRDYNA